MTYEDVLLTAGRHYRRQHDVECRETHPHRNRYDAVVFMEPLLTDAFGLELCMPQDDMYPELHEEEPRRLCKILEKDSVDIECAGKWSLIISKARHHEKEYITIERLKVMRVFADEQMGCGFVPEEEGGLLIVVDAENGMMYQTQIFEKGFDRPFCLNREIDGILIGDASFRAMMLDVFGLLSEYNPTWKDIIAHIGEYHQMGYPVEAQQIMSARNKNDLFHRLLGSRVPVNYNRISLIDGILTLRMEPLIKENELPLFAQVVKEGWLEKAKQSLLAGRRPALIDTAFAEELLGRMLGLYYNNKDMKNTNTDANRYREVSVYRDYVRLCVLRGQGVSFRYNSYRRLLREHDALMRTELITTCETLNQSIIAEHSDFYALRRILPEEFEWIKTDTRLLEEGKMQRNCVFVYKRQIENDHCAIYHWEHEGRQYTIEFVKVPSGFRIAQMKQTCNAKEVYQDRRSIERLLEQDGGRKAG